MTNGPFDTADTHLGIYLAGDFAPVEQELEVWEPCRVEGCELGVGGLGDPPPRVSRGRVRSGRLARPHRGELGLHEAVVLERDLVGLVRGSPATSPWV